MRAADAERYVLCDPMNTIHSFSLVLVLLLSCVGYSQESAKQNSAEVQLLVGRLRSEDDTVRYEAFQALSNLGQVVIPTIKKALNQETGYAKVYSARVLLKTDPEKESALKALAEIASNKQERKEVRRYACYVMVLSSAGINQLAAMLKNEDVFVRRSAAFALDEANENGELLPSDLKKPLYNALSYLALALADEDKIVMVWRPKHSSKSLTKMCPP